MDDFEFIMAETAYFENTHLLWDISKSYDTYISATYNRNEFEHVNFWNDMWCFGVNEITWAILLFYVEYKNTTALVSVTALLNYQE